MPLETEISARTMDEVRDWLAPELAGGAIEIGLVGDLDLDSAIEAVGATFGALPDRKKKPDYTAARQVSFPDEPFTRTYTVPTEIPKSIVALYWPTTDSRDVRVARRMSLLANVLTDRLRVKIREELGGAYSPRAASSPSDTYENYGYIAARITVEPDKANGIADVAIELAADLARNGVTEDELERAKEPVLTALRESARTNGYWLGAVLLSAQEFPQRLEWSRSRYSDIEGITTSELDVLAEAYLGDDKVFRVIVMPEGGPVYEQKAEEAPTADVK
jgi:zinc protease